MKKSELARKVARKTRLSPGLPPTTWSRVVNQIIRALRRGEEARLPGLGETDSGKDWAFEQESDGTVEDLALPISRELRKSPTVEVDALGVFARDETGRITLARGTGPGSLWRMRWRTGMADRSFANGGVWIFALARPAQTPARPELAPPNSGRH